MSSFHQQAVKIVCRICSSKILPHQSVDITKYLPIIQLWYDIDIDKETPDSPDIIPFFPTVLCKSCISALHKLEVGTRKSKPTGILLDIPPTLTIRQHDSDECLICKIYKCQKGIIRKAGNPIASPISSTYKPTSWQRFTQKKCHKCLSVNKIHICGKRNSVQNFVSTLSRLKYLHTTKLMCTNYFIY